ncbi:MAG: hypothetical protein B0D92_07640 [Spirochaeta sp. LUC14_002_19_P3]|nr:MAG: hypothetical protein B0D92_07640 [Spirochaeta sp. LUC14_002_19_P3]
MKTFYLYILSIIVGTAVAYIVPVSDAVSVVVKNVAAITLSIGSYLALPLIIFSLPLAITQLRRLKRLRPLLSVSSLYAVISTAALSVGGTTVALMFNTGRIPVVSMPAPDTSVISLGEMIQSIFHFKLSYGQENIALIVLAVPAFMLGWHFFHDKEIAEPAYNVFDSLSRLSYRACSGILLFMPLFLAILVFNTVYTSRNIANFQQFLPLLRLGFITVILTVFLVCPFLLRLAGCRRYCRKFLIGFAEPLAGAFISASPIFNYSNVTRHLKENFGIYRHTAASTMPIYTMFNRGGTAFISAICMITIIRSYSSLEITLFQAGWTALFAFLTSFMLPAASNHGLVTALVILGKYYGRGLELGWLILTPALPLLMMLSTLLDTASSAVLLLLVKNKTDPEEDEE